MPAIDPPPYILPIASTIPISLDRHAEHGIATDIDVVVAASDGNGIYLARLNECDRHPTMKPLWRRTVEYGVAMKSVSRATWRDGAHLDSAVDLRDRVGNDPAGRLLAAALSIRPSWYHSLDTNHNAPLPAHTVLDRSSHPSHGPNIPVGTWLRS